MLTTMAVRHGLRWVAMGAGMYQDERGPYRAPV